MGILLSWLWVHPLARFLPQQSCRRLEVVAGAADGPRQCRRHLGRRSRANVCVVRLCGGSLRAVRGLRRMRTFEACGREPSTRHCVALPLAGFA
jgi:hypothetical protein